MAASPKGRETDLTESMPATIPTGTSGFPGETGQVTVSDGALALWPVP